MTPVKMAACVCVLGGVIMFSYAHSLAKFTGCEDGTATEPDAAAAKIVGGGLAKGALGRSRWSGGGGGGGGDGDNGVDGGKASRLTGEQDTLLNWDGEEELGVEY